MSSYGDKITELNTQVADIGGRLASLADKRKEHSLAAAEGDTTARRIIGDIDSELSSLRNEAATLGAALETIAALQRQEAADIEQNQQRARQVDAYQHARGVTALNLEIDATLTHLREMFERRAALLAGLAQTNIVDSIFVARLASKAPATRAAVFAGLDKYLQFERPAPGSWRPLADTNTPLMSVGQPPEPEAEASPQPRVMSRAKRKD
jgi:hypothetical protein